MKNLFVRPVLALAAVGVFTTVVVSGCASAASPNAAEAAEAKPVSAVAQAAPLDLSEKKLSFVQKGAVVTVSKNGTVVATLTLKSATYTDTSGRAVFSMHAQQPVLLDTDLFVLYDADGGENSADSPRKVTLPTGDNTLTLNFRNTHGKPDAIGWAPQAGESGQATWER
jgi:hypothetical protein